MRRYRGFARAGESRNRSTLAYIFYMREKYTEVLCTKAGWRKRGDLRAVSFECMTAMLSTTVTFCALVTDVELPTCGTSLMRFHFVSGMTSRSGLGRLDALHGLLSSLLR